MPERSSVINYKGVEIVIYSGSNWAYINNRPFISLRSAKIYITKHLN